ncbi:GNAT family N-acetyltransferase [Desulforhopalus sp. 52FAK]
MLETTHLTLKKIVEDDIDLYRRMYKCPETTQYLPNGKPYSDEQINELIGQRIAHWASGFGTFTIFEKSTSNKIGYMGVERSPNPLFSDIRYGLEISSRRNGYAVNAAIACLKFTFDLGGHQKIYGASVLENHASLRVLQTLGMTEEANIDIYGVPDLIYLSLSKTDFEKQYNRGECTIM